MAKTRGGFFVNTGRQPIQRPKTVEVASHSPDHQDEAPSSSMEPRAERRLNRTLSKMGSNLGKKMKKTGDSSKGRNRVTAGGLDSLTLSSLYDEGAYRASQQPVYGAPAPNPFEAPDPFAFSNNIAAPPSTQMASVAQYQANPFGPYQQPIYSQPQQQPHMMMGPQNPFLDTGFGAFPVNNGAHQQTSNPFGSTGLI